MNNKTFGVVVGVIIALALAMFAGLYMLGLAGNSTGTFNDGYEYDYDDATTFYPYDEEGAEYYDDFAEYEDYLGDDFYFDEGDDFLYDEAEFYFDEDGNSYNFNDYEFEEFDYDPAIAE